MDSEGQRGPSNPSAMLTSLLSKRAKLHDELRNIERQVYEMETSYLQDPSQCGNVLKGFEGFLSASKSTALLKRSRKFQPEDRLFSLSSITSPAYLVPGHLNLAIRAMGDGRFVIALKAEEIAGGRDDGRSDLGVGRSKGGIFANGQGKPKKGRPAPRDAKKNRAAEQDFDYEDDPDLTS